MKIEELKAKKQELGYSYKQIAELSGLPVGTVQKVLGGITKSPRFDTLCALEQALFGQRRDLGEPIIYMTEDLNGRKCLVEETKEEYKAWKDSIGKVIAETPMVYQVREKTEDILNMKNPGEFTIEDYYKLPDERRVELIDGVFYDMAAPNCIHQLLAGQIYRKLADFIEKNKGKCIAVISPVDVQLDCDKKTMVQPDVLVVCDRRKFQKGRVFGAPDLIIEILSPSTTWKDRSVKMMKYCRAGVREYWMIDPKRKKVLVYDMQTEEFPAIYGFEHEVPVKIFDEKCKIPFAELYEHVRFLYEPEILDEEELEEE